MELARASAKPSRQCFNRSRPAIAAPSIDWRSRWPKLDLEWPNFYGPTYLLARIHPTARGGSTQRGLARDTGLGRFRVNTDYPGAACHSQLPALQRTRARPPAREP